MGDYQESIGIARIYHAKAAEMEIRNHAEWVRTYFELKELNKAYYLKEHPPFIDRQARIQRIGFVPPGAANDLVEIQHLKAQLPKG